MKKLMTFLKLSFVVVSILIMLGIIPTSSVARGDDDGAVFICRRRA